MSFLTLNTRKCFNITFKYNLQKASSYNITKGGNQLNATSLNLIRNKVSKSNLPSETSRPIKVPEDPYHFSELIKELISSQRTDDAIVILQRNSNKFHQPIVPWNILLKNISDQGRLNLAITLFNELKRKGIKPNNHTYSILIDGCAKSNSPNSKLKAQKIIDEMNSKFSNNSNDEQEGFNFKKANSKKDNFNIQTTKKEIQYVGKNKGMSIIEETPIMNGPSLFHYNNMLKVYSRSNDLVKMIELYDSMRENITSNKAINNYQNNANSISCAPDIVSYTIIVNALARIKSDDAFIETINIWLDYREDVELNMIKNNENRSFKQKEHNKNKLERNLEFDIGFLQAIILASRYCKDREYLFKGLQLIEQAFGMNLNVGYPKTVSFQKLPDLTEIEKNNIVQPNLAIIDLAITIASILKLHDVVPKIFFFFIENHSKQFKPDLKLYANVLSAHCHQVSELVSTFKNK